MSHFDLYYMKLAQLLHSIWAIFTLTFFIASIQRFPFNSFCLRKSKLFLQYNGTCPNGCQRAWSGEFCKIGQLCQPSPCLNDGVCLQLNSDDFECLCNEPFKGDLCHLGGCKTLPCLNFGRCTDVWPPENGLGECYENANMTWRHLCRVRILSNTVQNVCKIKLDHRLDTKLFYIKKVMLQIHNGEWMNEAWILWQTKYHRHIL